MKLFNFLFILACFSLSLSLSLSSNVLSGVPTGPAPRPPLERDEAPELAESGCKAAGNPIGIKHGNKFQQEVDFVTSPEIGLSFIRSYNSRTPLRQAQVGTFASSSTGENKTYFFQKGAPTPSADVLVDETSVFDGDTTTLYSGRWMSNFDQYIQLETTSSDFLIANGTYDGNPIYGLAYRAHRNDGKILTSEFGLGKAVSDSFGRRFSENVYFSENGGIIYLKDFLLRQTERYVRDPNSVNTWRIDRISKFDGPTITIQRFEGDLASTINVVEASYIVVENTAYDKSISIGKDSYNQLVTLVDTNQEVTNYTWNNGNLVGVQYPEYVNSEGDVYRPSKTYTYMSFNSDEDQPRKFDPRFLRLVYPYESADLAIPSLFHANGLPLGAGLTYWAYHTALTGIIDGEGNQVSSWEYDFTGFARAVKSYKGDGFEETNIISSRRVENANGFALTQVYNPSGRVGGEDLNKTGPADDNDGGCELSTSIFTSGTHMPSSGTYVSHSDVGGVENAEIVMRSWRQTVKSNGYAIKRTSGAEKVPYRVETQTQKASSVKPPNAMSSKTESIAEFFAHNSDQLNPATCDNDLVTLVGSSSSYCLYRGRRETKDAWGNVTSVVSSTQLNAGRVYEGTSSLKNESVYSLPDFNNKRTWNYEYLIADNTASFRLLQKIDGPRTDVEDVTTFAYYPTSHSQYKNLLHTKTDAEGNVTTYQEYNTSGLPTTILDANNVRLDLDYYPGNMIKSYRFNNNLTYKIDYYQNLLIKKITMPNDDYIYFEYNSAHYLTRMSNSIGESIEYSDFDLLGNAQTQTILDASGNLVRSKGQLFDAIGRITELTGADTQLTTLDIDGESQVTKISEALTSSGTADTSLEYDSFNRLVKITLPAATSNDTEKYIEYRYDKRDNLTHVTDQRGLTTVYQYDGLNNLLSETSPDTGFTEFKHDSAGNIIFRRDAAGDELHLSYDANNRLTRIYTQTNDDSTTLHSYEYDSADVSYGKGRLTSVSDVSGTSIYHYDVYGNVIKEERTRQGESKAFVTRYTYNSLNLLAEMVYPSGRKVKYTYDDLNQISSVSTRGPQDSRWRELVSDVKHAPFGPWTTYQYANSLTSSRILDNDYRIELTELLDDAIPVKTATYSYYRNNEIQTILFGNGLSKEFQYDTLHRLTQAEFDSSLINYTYDGIGNRKTFTKTSSDGDTTSTSYAYSPLRNQLETVTENNVNTSYIYDDVGDVITNGDFDFEYNRLGHLLSIKQQGLPIAEYEYNYANLRTLKRTYPGAKKTYFYYDLAGMLIAEMDQNHKVIREYVYHDGELIAILNPEPITWQGVSLSGGVSSEEASLSLQGFELPILQGEYFFGQPMQGDGSLAGRFDNIPVQPGESVAMGISLRESNSQDAVFASVSIKTDGKILLISGNINIPIVYGNHVIEIQYRDQTGGDIVSSSHQLSSDQLKLERVGSWIYFYQKVGGSWQEIHSLQVPMNDDAQIGYISNASAAMPINQARTKITSVSATGNVGEKLSPYAHYFVYNDHLSTPQIITDIDKQIVWSADYEPFGSAALTQNQITNPVRFPGQYFDQESGLHYNWHRYYDPKLGRYLQSDLIGLVGGMNTFIYVLNNPLINIDPDGLRGRGFGGGGTNGGAGGTFGQVRGNGHQNVRNGYYTPSGRYIPPAIPPLLPRPASIPIPHHVQQSIMMPRNSIDREVILRLAELYEQSGIIKPEDIKKLECELYPHTCKKDKDENSCPVE